MSLRAVCNVTDIFGLLQCAGINRISLPPKTSQTSKRSKINIYGSDTWLWNKVKNDYHGLKSVEEGFRRGWGPLSPTLKADQVLTSQWKRVGPF